MCDCFNMAYQENINPLQVHIKINSNNLIPMTQKYNAGSLRIPADPSWPKIPQRKLVDNVDDNISPPCTVTLTESPRRSHTVEQTPLNQSPKSTATKDSAYSSFHHQKVTTNGHISKRLPGYVDPRFKRVSNVKKSQLTSTESLQKTTDFSDTTCAEYLHKEKLEKATIPDKNINTKKIIIQKAEKPDEERIIKPSENYEGNNKFTVNNELSLQHNSTDTSELQQLDKDNKEVVDTNGNNQVFGKNVHTKNNISTKHVPQSAVNDANTQVEITPLAVQENNGQLFFVLDKKMQTHPVNAIHVDAITVPKDCTTRCYNIQLPVLTYQSIPMQVSPTGVNAVTQQCLNLSTCINQGNAMPLIKKQSEQYMNSNQTQDINKFVPNGNINPLQMHINNGKEPMEKENIVDECCNTLKVQSDVPEGNKKTDFKTDLSEKAFTLEKLQNSIAQQNLESSDSDYYIPNINKKNIYNSTVQHLKMKKNPCHSSGEETTDSEFVIEKCNRKEEFTNMHHGDEMSSLLKAKEGQPILRSNETIPDPDETRYDKYKTILCGSKIRNKSEQNLTCIKAECTRKLCRNSEPHITFKQKKMSAKFSRKARSYFQRNCHSALVDSDYTLAWPNCQHIKHKRDQANIHKIDNLNAKEINQHCHPVVARERSENMEGNNVSNFVGQHYSQTNDIGQETRKNLSKSCLQREHCKCETSPRSNTDDMYERSKAIPPKTQELLNKSYWEYYNRLKHKMKNNNNIEKQFSYGLSTETSAKEKRGKPSGICDKELRNQLKVNPELQTLQQCTALSTMINKALDSNLQSDIEPTKKLYLKETVKPLTKRVVPIQSANTKMTSRLADDNTILNNIKYNEDRTSDKQFLELKSIIFFGGMMYILIILLPMLYDYFYFEEYDNYENLSYVELIVNYILSSFKEAFGGVFEGVKKIFFYPVRLYTKF